MTSASSSSNVMEPEVSTPSRNKTLRIAVAVLSAEAFLPTGRRGPEPAPVAVVAA